MAAEIDHQHLHDHHDNQAFFESTASSCVELALDVDHLDYESMSITSIIDQGSVSFGKYATEALAWEKRCAFPHDRLQEELEKFKNPGLVAQKKAYFEEYYKKLKAMKALEALQQEINQHDACEDAQSGTTDIENTVTSTVSKDDNNVSQTPTSDNSTISSLNSSSEGTLSDLEQDAETQMFEESLYSAKDGMRNRIGSSMSTVKAKHSAKKTSSSQIFSSGSMKTALKKGLVSSAVNNKISQPKKQVPGLQSKGTVASVRNKTRLEISKTTKNAVKESEKPKPALRKITQTTDPSKKSGPKAESKTTRKITEVCPTVTVSNSLSAKDEQASSISSVRARLMKPSTTSHSFTKNLPTRLPVPAQSAKLVPSSSSVRTHLMKPSTTSKGLAGKLPTRSPVHMQGSKPVSSTSSIRAPRVKPSTTSEGLTERLPTRSSVRVPCAKTVSSSSSTGTPSVKPNTTQQGLVKKLPSKLPVNSQSFKSISKDKASIGGLRNANKSSADLSSPSTSNQNIGSGLGHRSLVQGGKQKEAKEKVVAELKRDPKAALSTGTRRDTNPASPTVSNISKALRGKSDPKIAAQKSAGDKRVRTKTTTNSACRQMTPKKQ